MTEYLSFEVERLQTGQMAFQKVPALEISRWSIKYLTSFLGRDNITWDRKKMIIFTGWQVNLMPERTSKWCSLNFIGLQIILDILKNRFWISQSKVWDSYFAFLVSGQMMLICTLSGQALELFFFYCNRIKQHHSKGKSHT